MSCRTNNQGKMSINELCHKPDLPSIIRSCESCDEPSSVLENIKVAINYLPFYQITHVEDLIRHVMPIIMQTMKQVYNENNLMVQSDEYEVLDRIKSNIQVALSLVDTLNHILENIMEHETIPFVQIPSFPVHLAEVLLLTFEHCKNSRKTYPNHKSVTHILELFRKAQEVHTKFLNFLDICLIFNFLNENEVVAFKNLLDTVIKISEMLSGINMKSMADNWKCFITLTQKYCSVSSTNSVNLSSPIKNLTAEINSNLQTIIELGPADLQKSSQTLKIVGFLIKVALKLFETCPNILQNYDDILHFCLVIYSWHYGFFQTNKFPDDCVEDVKKVLYFSTESFVSQLFSADDFLKKFCQLHKNDLLLRQSFGFLSFSNELLKNVPKLSKAQPDALKNFEIVSLLRLIFDCTTNCYKEFYCDYNSIFYEELVINISVAVLIFSNNYLKIETVLLDCVAQEKIWPAMIAIDIWCVVLRHSSMKTCYLTLNVLVTKIQELKLGIFVQTPAIIYLKILTQRIFKILPNSIMNEVMSKYNPADNLPVWKILNLKSIPLSQRFYIEFVLSDAFDKMDILKKEDCSVNDVISLAENLDIISSTNFNGLEINISRLVPIINRLWFFNASHLSESNNVYKYFIYKLAVITKAVARELTEENLVLVLNQLKQLPNETLFKLLICDIVKAISWRNFHNSQEKLTLFSLISKVFQILLTDNNPIIIQIALEAFQEISENDQYEAVVNKVLTCSPAIKQNVIYFMQKNATEMKYSVKYFEKNHSSTFQHRCVELTDSEMPQCKKIKIENDIDDVINNLKSGTQRLSKIVIATQLNSRQAVDVKDVISKLEKLLI